MYHGFYILFFSSHIRQIFFYLIWTGSTCLVLNGQELGPDSAGHVSSSFSQMALKESLKEGCLRGNCVNDNGTYYFSEQEALYQGSFRTGMPHGKGTCVYGNGERYSGNWHKGYFNGKGVLQLNNGTLVSGIWQEGKLIKTVRKTELFPEGVATNAPTHGEVYAVIVGISNYTKLPILKYADDDAYRMYAHLRSPEGGAVPEENFELLIDDGATKDKIKYALKSIVQKAAPEDRIVFFYSGHGLQNAFLPYDSDGFDQRLSHEYIQSLLGESECKNKLIFADACLSRLGMEESERWKEPSKLLENNDLGTVVLLSSKMSETSLESDGLRQGVFSYFLFRGLSGAADLDMDQQVTIGELYRFVARHVVEYTSGLQHPILGGQLMDAVVLAQR